MFVPCPHCQFLVAHHPQLRPLPADCPRCGRPLQEDIEPATVAGVGTTSGQEQDIADTGYAAHQAEASVASAPMAFAAESWTCDGDDAVARKTQAASTDASAAPAAAFVAPIGRGGWTRWRWPLVALLALLLALQILLADRARLGEDPRWRPVVEALCGALHCSLPPWRQPDAFTMLDRKVRPASQPGALRVDATFRNDARWAQAWPALQLALSDADGRVLGSRVFRPDDYLGTTPTTMLSPGQSAQVTFMVQEPAPGTVAFSFEFR